MRMKAFEKPPVAQLLKNSPYYETWGSLPSQKTSTGHCPEPDEYSPYHPNLSRIRFNISVPFAPRT
jgi:hypothetical protein